MSSKKETSLTKQDNGFLSKRKIQPRHYEKPAPVSDGNQFE